jgi:hypothetical protein
MEVFADPHRNRLLTALPPAERARIEPHLQFVPLPLGTVLYESGDLSLLRVLGRREARNRPASVLGTIALKR